MKQEQRHIFIGLLTVLLLTGIFAVGYSHDPDKHEKDGYRVWASFDTVVGLSPGDPVLLAGFEVGAVRKIDLDFETNEALVEMTLGDGINIPIDSEASIISSGFAGGKYIRITPGGDFEYLQPGEPFDYTTGSVDFLALFEKIVLIAEKRRGLE